MDFRIIYLIYQNLVFQEWKDLLSAAEAKCEKMKNDIARKDLALKTCKAKLADLGNKENVKEITRVRA